MKESVQATIHQLIPLTKALGIRVDEARSGYVRLSMPANELIMNHIGSMHSVALYGLAEIAAGSLLLASLDFSRFNIINISGRIQNHRKGIDLATAEVSLSDQELSEIVHKLESGEKVDQRVRVVVKDGEGNELCESEFEMLLREWTDKHGASQ